jgi:DNA-binding response OmpR family regulator
VNETSPFTAESQQRAGRALVLAADPVLTAEIERALREAAPATQLSVAGTLEEAQRLVMHDRPDLFVLDLDATQDRGQEFLYDLRTSHPNARAIILTGAHFAGQREQGAGVGAVHFLEKPFPHADFVTLADALLAPAGKAEGEKFQGTLSDLHIADIIQLKCISGSTSALEFTGPTGEKARVYFEAGQVRHATAPGKEGVAAFNEIVNWTGGKISEIRDAGAAPRTIDVDWQVLLMEAVRKIDETRGARLTTTEAARTTRRKVLVIDDSLMLLSFVKEILTEANYDVTAAATAQEGVAAAAREVPDLILLDYVLPDMKGDQISAQLLAHEATAKTPILYMSGFGSDLRPEQITGRNVIGSLNKPFTSDLLTRTVEQHMPPEPSSSQPTAAQPPENAPTESSAEASTPQEFRGEAATAPPQATDAGAEPAEIATAAGATAEPWWSAPASAASWPETAPAVSEPVSAPQQSEAPAENFTGTGGAEPPAAPAPDAGPSTDFAPAPPEPLPMTGNTFFSGDSSFFSLHWALQTIGKQKLTGVLRSFWDKEPVELLARNGEVVLVTTRDTELYCPEAPITLVNVDASQSEAARAEQRETGCPLFLALTRQNLILREPALQLVQHYGQKLFAQLWTAPRVRFVFQLMDELPAFASDVSSDPEIDQWVLSTLRFIQFQELRDTPDTESNRIPAYTRDGYERVQQLRLTVAEAQFASQFNGVRSVAQIAKNLRLDIKFARLTLFRFLALEIVECWPPTATVKQDRRGTFQRIGSLIGFGD